MNINKQIQQYMLIAFFIGFAFEFGGQLAWMLMDAHGCCESYFASAARLTKKRSTVSGWPFCLLEFFNDRFDNFKQWQSQASG